MSVDRLAALIDPIPVPTLVSVLCEWLRDAHEVAAEHQRLRLSGPRGDWNNSHSFGTDRYQFLVRTAESLTAQLPDLQVEWAFQTVALKLPKVGIYQMQVHGGPNGSLADASDLRRELLNGADHQALFSRPDALFGDRERLALVWTGAEQHGLTGAWIGQGELVDNRVDWDWCDYLLDMTNATGVPRRTGPLDPTIFDVSEPTLPLRPRHSEDGRRSG
ncbi:hypothetical protein [Actinophytocola oryzae]|uniref:Uncharacterized protein n=1 Tax=Actinophytocola oryzae TaxID=502181 RepID=A0A4R7V4N0_9PSEU|nr:hypothetical protein [Actinophytocola oryzae]TDV43607.1 hypothetical protein CLV71_11569 [Actinophytocola oryzae]